MEQFIRRLYNLSAVNFLEICLDLDITPAKIVNGENGDKSLDVIEFEELVTIVINKYKKAPKKLKYSIDKKLREMVKDI